MRPVCLLQACLLVTGWNTQLYVKARSWPQCNAGFLFFFFLFPDFPMPEATGPPGCVVEQGGEREACDNYRLTDAVVRDPGGQVALGMHGV